MFAKDPSIRGTITRQRRSSLRYAAFNVWLIGISVGVLITTHRTWVIAITATQAMALMLNVLNAIKAHQALTIYRNNPVAAYIAEVRHAFTTTGFVPPED